MLRELPNACEIKVEKNRNGYREFWTDLIGTIRLAQI